MTTGTAMSSPKRLAYKESDKHPQIEQRGTDINTCSDSSPTGS